MTLHQLIKITKTEVLYPIPLLLDAGYIADTNYSLIIAGLQEEASNAWRGVLHERTSAAHLRMKTPSTRRLPHVTSSLTNKQALQTARMIRTMLWSQRL